MAPLPRRNFALPLVLLKVMNLQPIASVILVMLEELKDKYVGES
jgi:hypothetical protein